MNRFKTDPKEEKKKENNKSFKLPFIKKIEFNAQTKRSIGIVLLMLAVFMLLSFMSFIGTFKADYGIVNKIRGEYLTSINPELPSNWMGYIGAVLAHKFIYTWFGLASFLFPLFLGLWALSFSFDIKLKNQSTINKTAIFILFWLPIALSILAKGKIDFLAGGYGVCTP